MRPALQPAQLVVASGWFRQVQPGQVVIVVHNGLEKIKRVQLVDSERQSIFVTGDNAEQSTDSRQFGWLPLSAVVAIVVWPSI